MEIVYTLRPVYLGLHAQTLEDAGTKLIPALTYMNRLNVHVVQEQVVPGGVSRDEVLKGSASNGSVDKHDDIHPLPVPTSNPWSQNPAPSKRPILTAAYERIEHTTGQRVPALQMGNVQYLAHFDSGIASR